MSLTTYTGGYILGGVADETPDWLGSYNEGMNAAIDQNTALLGQKETKQRMAENAAAEARRATEFGWKQAEYQRIEDAWGATPGSLGPIARPQGPGLGPMPTQVIPAAIAPNAGLQAELAAPNAPVQGSTDLITQMLPQWARLEQATGLPPNYLETISMLESSGGTNTGNGQYVGVFQIGPEVAADFGVTPEQLQDPVINSQVAAKLAGRNAKQLRDAFGREPQGWEIYLAHQQGAAGAIALLDNPNARAVDALAAVYGGDRNRAQQAVVQNGGNPNMSAAEFAALWQTKFAGGRPQPFTGGPTQTAGVQPPRDPNASGLANDFAGLSSEVNTSAAIGDIVRSLSDFSGTGGRTNAFQQGLAYAFGTDGQADQMMAANETAATARAWYSSSEVQNWLRANPNVIQEAKADPIATYNKYKDQVAAAAATDTAGLPTETGQKGDLPAGLKTDGTPAVPAPAPAPADPALPTAGAPGLTPPSGDVVPAITREDFAGVNVPGQGSIAAQIMRTPAGQQTALPDSGQYMVEPAKIRSDMFELQQASKLLEQQYAEAVRFRDREGMIAIRQKHAEIGAATRLVENMQSIAALQAGDVNKVSQTLSRLTGGQVRIQPRSDGKFNVFYNGKMTYEGVTQEAFIAALRSEYDAQYQSQVSAALKRQDEIDMEILKGQVDTNKQITIRQADAYKQIAIDKFKSEIAQVNPDLVTNVQAGPDGQPQVIVTPKNGRGQPRIFTVQPILGVDGQPLLDAAGNPKTKMVELGGTSSVPVQ